MSRKDIRTNKLHDQQIIACAKANGYKGKSKEITKLKLTNGVETGEWWIKGSKFIVTNEMLVQYQRDCKLKRLFK